MTGGMSGVSVHKGRVPVVCSGPNDYFCESIVKQMRNLITAVALAVSGVASAASPYISKVYEYCPAPGQFVNDVPEVSEGSDPAACAAEQLVGDAQPGLVSLGAFGGYIVFGFDHPVVNVAGEADFRIYGNAILTSAEKKIASSEPGIVWVSQDTNGNGLPDDEWFELEGSESERTERGLTVTYSRPQADHQPVADPAHKFLVDAEYIAWECSDGTSGWIQKNNQHAQDYWPSWVGSETLTFTASRLPDNAVDTNGKGTSYTSYMYDWGYADNRPNNDPEGFDISRAVDAQGRPVNLGYADFIKVQTAVRQNMGWLGESSTEIAGAEDLHPDLPTPPPASVGGLSADREDSGIYYDLHGRRVSPSAGVPVIEAGSRRVIVK